MQVNELAVVARVRAIIEGALVRLREAGVAFLLEAVKVLRNGEGFALGNASSTCSLRLRATVRRERVSGFGNELFKAARWA